MAKLFSCLVTGCAVDRGAAELEKGIGSLIPAVSGPGIGTITQPARIMTMTIIDSTAAVLERMG
jgi:hypothetical protein